MSFLETALVGLETSELDIVPVRQEVVTGRKPQSLPSISVGRGLLSRYDREKIAGLRRETGARKLNRLSNRHLNMIAMHLSGMSGADISQAIGCTQSTVSRILNDPLAQEVILQTYRDRQQELDALTGSALEALRNALKHGSGSEKLAAIDKLVKLKQAIAPETNPMETAEDFARAIVEKADTVNVQINHYGEGQ